MRQVKESEAKGVASIESLAREHPIAMAQFDAIFCYPQSLGKPAMMLKKTCVACFGLKRLIEPNTPRSQWERVAHEELERKAKSWKCNVGAWDWSQSAGGVWGLGIRFDCRQGPESDFLLSDDWEQKVSGWLSAIGAVLAGPMEINDWGRSAVVGRPRPTWLDTLRRHEWESSVGSGLERVELLGSAGVLERASDKEKSGRL
jgi:hypothetical protein